MLGKNFEWSSEDREAKEQDRRRKRPTPPDDAPREVTLQDLGQLPMRAAVAFASRCARRVQPAFRPPEDFPHRGQAFDVIEAAIRLAEGFAAGADGPPPGDTTARLAYQLGEATCDLQLFAPYAAYHAARAVGQAAAAGGRADEDTASEVVAAAYGACRVVMLGGVGSRPDPESLRLVCAAMCADLDTLRDLSLGSFRDLGGPVDTSESGPLGPLWPDGVPTGF